MVLMYSGAGTTVKDRDGRTLLHVVLSGGSDTNMKLANMLCDFGQSLEDMSSNGKTVFEHLTSEGLVPALEEVSTMSLCQTVWPVST